PQALSTRLRIPPYSPRVPSARQLVWRWATPGPFDQAPDHPRTFCPRHRTAPVPFRSGAHPPPDLLPQAPDRPRAFSVRRPPTPGPFAPGTGPPPCLLPRAPHPRTVLPRDLGRSHHVITPTRPPKAPSRANWSASGPLSRTSPLPARHHPPPCILPKPPPRQLVWRWATPGPFDQAPDHPRTAPCLFGPAPTRPRTFCPRPLARQEGHPPARRRPPRGHMRVRGQGRGPAEKIPVAVSRGAIHKSLPAGQLAQHPAKPRNRPSGRANGSPCGQLAPASARGEGPPRPLGGDLGSQKKEQWSPVGGWPTRYPFPPSKHPAL
ncbi:hypothetical protein P170DRAFT_486481, partial [Aspergillus steynii IBT 23096]